MRVYVFGNSFLLVVVILGFRKVVEIVEIKYGDYVIKFV